MDINQQFFLIHPTKSDDPTPVILTLSSENTLTPISIHIYSPRLIPASSLRLVAPSKTLLVMKKTSIYHALQKHSNTHSARHFVKLTITQERAGGGFLFFSSLQHILHLSHGEMHCMCAWVFNNDGAMIHVRNYGKAWMIRAKSEYTRQKLDGAIEMDTTLEATISNNYWSILGNGPQAPRSIPTCEGSRSDLSTQGSNIVTCPSSPNDFTYSVNAHNITIQRRTSFAMAEETVTGCVSVRDVAAEKFIAAYAQVLKNNDKFHVPKWADTVKTGVSRELAPYDPDWFFVRAASIARKIYLRQGTGVGALKTRYGKVYRRGARPEKHQDAAGGIIRTILTTLDTLKITEKCPKGGRRVSRVGQQALDLVAGQVARNEV
eukprot:gene2093-4095_t